MAKVYKVHPGIGVARVGRSGDGFFLAGESPDAGPFELDANGAETAFADYKDASHVMRRQGVRFRVFEYDQPAAGAPLALVREITSADATIAWTVRVSAAKAAGPLMGDGTGPDGNDTIVPKNGMRNAPPPGFTRDDLKIDATLSVSGANQPSALARGAIAGADLVIGEIRTDAAGRLVALAGRGEARSWGNPPPPLDGDSSREDEFLNNPTWYDDIFDGTVDAKVTFPGAPPVDALGAWVIAAPPDFAPHTASLTTMLDIVEDALRVPLPARLTYPQDIEPMLKRAAGLFFVNDRPVWKVMNDHMKNAAGLNDPSAVTKPARKRARDDLLKAQGNPNMSAYSLTQRQIDLLQSWVDGRFQTAADPARPAPNAAETLDRAVLGRCVGGGFFPGIEAGTTRRQPTIYVEFARLTRGAFADVDNASRTLTPGLITQRMACPWHADFAECLVNWWPAQRPDITGRDGAAARPRWDRGVLKGGDARRAFASHVNMVNHFAQLGVLVKESASGGLVETGRDPNLANSA